MRTRVYWLTAIALALCPAVAALAQSEAPRVTLELDSSDFRVGEGAGLDLTIHEFQTAEAPDVPQSSELNIIQLGAAREATYAASVNGRVTSTHQRTYSFEVVPQRTGDITIPSFSVRVDGQVIRTEPRTIRVQPSDADEVFWVEVSCARKRLFVGQRATLKLTIFVRPPSVGGNVYDVNMVWRMLQLFQIEPFQARQGQVEGGTANRARGRSAASRYYTYTFTTEFSPDRPGTLAFDNIDVGIQYPRGRSSRRLRARPEVEPIEIVPLPTQDRPAGFAGAVGVFGIDVAAKPTSVRVGDPIELTIDIYGDGDVGSLPPPKLSADAALARAFRLPEDIPAGELAGRKRRFTTVIRAQRSDVTAIPPIEYPYFDPDTEAYRVARSKPIPLTVQATESLDAADLAHVASPAADDSAPLRALDGLRGNETSESLLLASAWRVTPTQLVLAAGAPPAAFCLLWGVGALMQRSRTSPQRHRAAALRKARRAIESARGQSPADAAARISAGLRDYLAERTAQPAASFAGREAVERLRGAGASVDVLDRVARLLDACDAVSFGGSAATVDLTELARQCLTDLEREAL